MALCDSNNLFDHYINASTRHRLPPHPPCFFPFWFTCILFVCQFVWWDKKFLFLWLFFYVVLLTLFSCDKSNLEAKKNPIEEIIWEMRLVLKIERTNISCNRKSTFDSFLAFMKGALCNHTGEFLEKI